MIVMIVVVAERFNEAMNYLTVTLLIVIGVTGLSCAPVFAFAIASTTPWLAASFTSPKIECLRFNHVVGATVIKNCEPFVPGPEFAIARMYGRSKVNSPWNSSAKR